jgi:regulator of replication initiation timing
MKLKIIFSLLTLFTLKAIGQTKNNDSVLVTRYSDNYIEVKSLRHVLNETQTQKEKDSEKLVGLIIKTSYIPTEPILKDGMVAIKDKNDNLLFLNFYKDSMQIQSDKYVDNLLSEQEIANPSDSSFIEKYYYKSGRLQSIYVTVKRRTTVVKYSESGQVIYNSKE